MTPATRHLSDQCLLSTQQLIGIIIHSLNINMLEMVQRRSVRYVFGDFNGRSSVTAMLQEICWLPLATRQRLSRLEMMYRIRFDFIDIDWSKYLIPLTSPLTRGHHSRFLTPRCRTDVFINSFFRRTTHDWNNLEFDPAAFPTLDAFKTMLRVDLP